MKHWVAPGKLKRRTERLRRLGASNPASLHGGPHGPGPARRRLPAVACALGLALVMGGCGSISDFVAARGSELPGIGLPEGAPVRPVTRASYPAVHDMPPVREAPLLDEAEQRKVEDDLMAARARNQRAGGQPAEPPPEDAPAGRGARP